MIESLAELRTQLNHQPYRTLYDFDADDPRALRPLSLEQQKKCAKDLLKKWRGSSDKADKKLADAQHMIAQGHGFKNWPQLKAHIQQSEIARAALKEGVVSCLDGNQKTLHIRCGSDIKHALVIAGFSGDFLNFCDPYVHGPVPAIDDLDEFIKVRAAYIASDGNPPFDVALKQLRNMYSGLEAAKDYDAVYIWLEHDSYDQLILAKLLDFFSDISKRPTVLKLLCATHYPGVKIFNGLGQLPPEALRVLWQDFASINEDQFEIGRQAWTAVCSSNPDLLRKVIAMGTPPLPTMANALKRHLQQLPSKQNGLNLTEQLTLQILVEKGSMNAARLFGWYTNHYELLTFMGDTGYWEVLRDLARAKYPAIILDEQGKLPKQWQVQMTQTGEKLLNNELDWLQINTVDRWLGGIHLDNKTGMVFRAD